ncbi:ZYRO0E01474p [Zygosaccharomyces rouxii]|uniref:ZYRO0E01474p n=1 Tax=Zygosaccharomyces rouxii (strain ATCC 2623 / CBS 732 / NBRC 1130 / NCYC 568 / NRRL Y-229) TaxID=559307 RepID=C5E3Z5_ZYGRC|nr:uncharacterized protein ZYRO0E01474g [Zygosaccharomyces rouxii]KAH9198383.1 Hsp70 protein-domain-containing protein [Zygosaccharomyces rouxii]CAR30756.1 ZYRO0E01474p [Zygosaccharomyces rouxii]
MRNSIVLLLISIWSIWCHFTLAAVVGVDYGQQFIKAMVVSPRAPMELIFTPEAKRKEISGLAIKSLGGDKGEIERIYGSALGSMATRFPKNTLLHVKSLLGKTINDEGEISTYLNEHPGIDIVPNKRNSLSFVVGDEQYPVEEVTAMNLQETINRANLLLREKDPSGSDLVDKLALTVPEYFDQYQRRALLDSGSLTTDALDTYLVPDGLSVVINFVLKKRDFKGKSYYVVYDMGGGSTKASLFSIEQPENETEPLRIEFGGYGYDSQLGGSNFTLQVASLIENKFLSKRKDITAEKLHRNPKAVAKIVQAAEKAKLILSANSEASISIESVLEDVDFKTKITKQEFEDSLSDSASEIVKPIKVALDGQFWDEKIDPKQVSGIILTGGSSRVPIVQYKLAEYMGENKILKSVNADEAAVDGATIRGIKLFEAFRTKPLNITERSISDYAVTLNQKGENVVVFPKGTVFPTKRTLELGNAKDLPKDFDIKLWENGLPFQSVKTKTSGADDIYSPEKCPNGVIYNATFSISQNRLFNLDKVEAICLKDGSSSVEKPQNETGKKSNLGSSKRSVKLTISSEGSNIKAMSSDEQLRLREYIRILDQKDAARFELEEAKNLLEALLYDARSYLELEEVVEKGPQSYLGKLSEAVTKHLSWLEDEADETTKLEVIQRSSEVQQLRDKLEAYLQSLSEPLDSKQFQSILNNATKLLEQIDLTQINQQEQVASLKDKFEELGHNVEEQYAKIKLPHHIAAPLSSWNDTVSAFKEVIKLVEYAKSSAFKKMGREQLFEIKSAFDIASAELESIIDYFGKARDYRLHELQAWIQKAEKTKKRKEERLKKKMEDKEKEKESKSSSTVSGNPSTAESESSTVPTTTTTASASASTTSPQNKQGTSSSTATTPLHDEL